MSTGSRWLGLICAAGIWLGCGSALGAELATAGNRERPAELGSLDTTSEAPASGGSAPASVDRELPSPPLTQRHWYGWQTLAMDGAGFGLIIVGGTLKFEGPAGIAAVSAGVTALILGGPAVHAAHGRWPTAALDLGLRIGLPLIGGFVGSQDCPGECWGPALAGLMIGLLPIPIDAAVLAREDVPLERAADAIFFPRSLARLGVSEIRPTTALTRRGLVLGLDASF